MWRASIFYKFFNYKNTSHHRIKKFSSSKKLDLQEKLIHRIIEIDQEISQNSKALLEAQIVKFRSALTKSENLIEKIGHNVYKKKVEESINWYKKELKELHVNRNDLQINLEKIQGIYWLNRIKRFIKLILIAFFLVLGTFIFLSSFMIIIYLLAFFILILLGYSLATKKY